MRLLVALACIVAVNAIPFNDVLNGGRGFNSDLGGRGGSGFGGQRGGGFQSGYESGGSDRGRDYVRDSQDFRATVESSNSRVQDSSRNRGSMDRGYQSGGYGNSGRSGYGI